MEKGHGQGLSRSQRTALPGTLVQEIGASIANRRPIMRPCSQLTVVADDAITDYFRLSEWLLLAAY